VLDGSTRGGVPQATIDIAALEQLQCGSMELSLRCLTGDDGSYELLVPDAPNYRAYVSDSRTDRTTEVNWDGTIGRDEVRDFELP
jgi:hypothetical protein